ncbi:hypothetical protein CCY99_02270 [Helicobacter sp. 16-1353]|uniref:type I glyceraldehyde-3-phosphate dehydrogenase n=1 Tax=Helicobacter sp. 16-1353 TaxID=2004996 RepID=UPI000DCC707F|nr:glyceraldehyde 3-phosphate dehydrogenase NAD-binding domain-containing protein [Helicobacter sp. 16-1353]RAX54610.1 hypothetical protein CCY99_02270 [Helicobacter sp. 16-1353]
MKIAINGFGRIGRAFFRILESIPSNDLQITHINDTANFDKLIYLLKKDSVFGGFGRDCKIDNNKLIINNREIILSSFKNPKDSTFENVDLVLECSGEFLDMKSLESYIKNGASKVILSAPPKDEMPIYVCGVNEDSYKGEKIISNASCTSNAIAPIIKKIKEKYHIIGGNISIIHPFNNDQSLLDSPHREDIRLSRNATLNIIPTTSSIGKVLGKLFNELNGKFYGDSIRIPTSIVAFSNIDLLLREHISKDDILGIDFNNDIIGFDNEMSVSSDFIGELRSAVIASDLIKINHNLCRISIWFDNESGYAMRLIDMAKIINA